MRKRSAAAGPPKTSAAERTEPMKFTAGANVKCGVCDEIAESDALIEGKNGVLECPSCGAPLTGPNGKGKEIANPPTGTVCSVCLESQFQTPSGVVCKNGHGGAEPMAPQRPDLPTGGIADVSNIIDRSTQSPQNVDVNDGPPVDDRAATKLIAGAERAASLPSKALAEEDYSPTDESITVAAAPHEPPPKTYCAECGTEWAIVNGKLWPNCGHNESAGNVGNPNHARHYKPAGGSASARIVGRTLVVSTAKHTFPTAPYGSFQIQPFTASIELGPNANFIEVARETRAQLKKLQEEAFQDELDWYVQKFEKVKGEG